MIWFKSNCWSNFSWIMHFLGWQIKCLKDPCIKNGPIWASSKNLPFFLDVTSKLFQHISGFSDVKYQMTWCIEHEKYPNCVRLCTIVSVIDDLLVTVDRNTLYLHTLLRTPSAQCPSTLIMSAYSLCIIDNILSAMQSWFESNTSMYSNVT